MLRLTPVWLQRLFYVLQVMQSMRNANHRTWSGETETLVVLDPQTNRLLR